MVETHDDVCIIFGGGHDIKKGGVQCSAGAVPCSAVECRVAPCRMAPRRAAPGAQVPIIYGRRRAIVCRCIHVVYIKRICTASRSRKKEEAGSRLVP